MAGKEFGELCDHRLIVVKALYGLRSSGKRWAERLADCLREMGFQPCKAEPCIWMRRIDDHWEYLGSYVDDLAIVSKNPKAITDILESKYKFKLKGTGPISFHLGCDFIRDEDGVLCIAPCKYIEKMEDTYLRLFGTKPSTKVRSPLESGDHPEMDTSVLLEDDDITKYQSMIGALQWAISLARFDIATAVMTMSSFRVAPRQGHLDRLKRIYGYLSAMKHACLRIRVTEPDYSSIPEAHYDWAYTVYGDIADDLPPDAPEPLGHWVQLSHFVDANLLHDLMTGRSVTGILDFLNSTPIDWYSKKQATVETATYGSEFVAARTAVERNVDLRTTLLYLGVPVRKKAYLFGDNKSVVDSAMTPHAKLHKHHNALSFHRVREAIAAKLIDFRHVRSAANPADVLSKHWGYQAVWPLLQPLLFWRGDTKALLDLDKAKRT